MKLVRLERETKLDVETARELLARCRSTDEVRGLRDKAKAVSLYMRERGASLAAQTDAAEIAIRAERRLGELLREAPKAKGATEPGTRRGTREAPRQAAPTLADQGITKKQASRWQQLAAVPTPRFEEHVKSVREKAERLTSASVLHAVSKPSTAPALAWGEDDSLVDVREALDRFTREWRENASSYARLRSVAAYWVHELDQKEGKRHAV